MIVPIPIIMQNKQSCNPASIPVYMTGPFPHGPCCETAHTVGRDDPARRLAVGKEMQLPASGTPSGRALHVLAAKQDVGAAISRPMASNHGRLIAAPTVSFTVMHSGAAGFYFCAGSRFDFIKARRTALPRAVAIRIFARSTRIKGKTQTVRAYHRVQSICRANHMVPKI